MKRVFARWGAALMAAGLAFAVSGCGDDSATSPYGGAGGNVMTDSRDGQTYKTVKIGNQVWMAENLNYAMNGSLCYNNEQVYCNKYGRLYTWNDAINACPDGWHLPNKDEFEGLRTLAGQTAEDIEKAGVVLKSKSGWAENGYGTDDFGFGALPAGDYDGIDEGLFDDEGKRTRFWSSTEESSGNGYYLRLRYNSDNASINSSDKRNGLSVRCVKD
ncbi:MAG: fibrobacter succinogenes major paralogous domain-containing protein [Fibrobacter sp.]|nr:fibrobacter succinogenes major paralogous domain-containing protein [Fibrobacter sp.]